MIEFLKQFVLTMALGMAIIASVSLACLVYFGFFIWIFGPGWGMSLGLAFLVAFAFGSMARM